MMVKLIIIIQTVLFTCITNSSTAFDYDIDTSTTYFEEHIDELGNTKEVEVVKIPKGVEKIILKDAYPKQTWKHVVKPKNVRVKTEESDEKTIGNKTFGNENDIARTYDENIIKMDEPDLNNFKSSNINSIRFGDADTNDFESEDADKKATNLKADKINHLMQRNASKNNFESSKDYKYVAKPIHGSEKGMNQNNDIRNDVTSDYADILDSEGRDTDQYDYDTNELHEIISTNLDVEPTEDDMNDFEPTDAEVFDTTYSDSTEAGVTDTKSKFALSTEKYTQSHTTFNDSEGNTSIVFKNADIHPVTSNPGDHSRGNNSKVKSVLPVLSHILERIVNDGFLSFLQKVRLDQNLGHNSTADDTNEFNKQEKVDKEAKYDSQTNAPDSKITKVGRSWFTYTKIADGTTESEEVYERDTTEATTHREVTRLSEHLGEERQAETGRRNLKQGSGTSNKFTESTPDSRYTGKYQDVINSQDTHAGERDHKCPTGHGLCRSELHTFPFAVSIQRKGAHHATGALVDKRWILSVAKEFYNTRESVKLFRAKLGSVNCKKGGVLLPITRIEVHPAYKLGSPNHDLALLRLAQPVDHTDSIRPVRLLNLESNLVNGVFTTIYWPRLLVNGTLLDTKAKERLHHNSLRVSKQFSIDWGKCEKLISIFNHNTTLEKSTLCLQPVVTDHSFCMPDPGAPVLTEHGLWGITSGWTSEDCVSKQSPTVFTRVSAPEVRVWIEKQMHRYTDM